MSRENPWTTVSSRTVYENPWITVREDQVIRPDGAPGIYGVVDCRAATGVVAVNDHGELCLVGQFRYPTNEYSWEIIEGGAEKGETPLEAAKRELREEGGLVAKSWSPLGGEIHLTNCHSSERGYLFLARDLESVEAAPEGTEILEIRWVTLDNALKSVAQGEIRDALTLIALERFRAVIAPK